MQFLLRVWTCNQLVESQHNCYYCVMWKNSKIRLQIISLFSADQFCTIK